MSTEQNNLSLEKQAKLEMLRTNFAFLNSLLTQRTALVSVIASLSAMVLIVATFNEKLLPLTEDIKVAITILLLLIPISLFFSIWEIHSAIEIAVKEITNVLGGKDPFASKSTLGKIKTVLVAYMPLFLGFVLSIVIIWIILIIWGFEI